MIMLYRLRISTLALSAVLVNAAHAGTPAFSSDMLAIPGRLAICADFPAPPQEMYTDNGEPTGSDVDTGNAIAEKLGLKPVWVNTVFDTIILALNSGKCDLIVTGMLIKPEREKQIDLIPYFTAGEQLLVRKGNPKKISSDYKTVCGNKVATNTGSAQEERLAAWNKTCAADGLPPITVISSPKSDTALQQLMSDRADAFFNDSPTVQYYRNLQPDNFDLGGEPIGVLPEGIGVAKADPGLKTAVTAALRQLQKSGDYHKILEKYGLQDTRVPPLP
ncbi:ABC transporter substrate-binding protein [Mesorhizobium sp. M7D.F.Ca.US.004.03.1.1]|uniref:ABC transporter substrate-binding protein n=1 Tax=Mesorhizobium sp. M7D.F.Ca.US.004.03.1.1 TaxID=2496702 RepID=UPI000FC9D3D5|nr:ABC transporter substrate-binding protein [Mesorhizobium sp. M7D.F.Ca.US.004.03.1.1]RVA21118.1 ABC transporter substrate-binding protein [Mesorhizobium sp. M7D.F.Ca.US.004.03.1.1]